jgi:hypothetical protein
MGTKDGKCYICENREPEFFDRCDKHDVCLICGKHRSELKEMPWGARGGFRCKPCETARIKNKIREFQSSEDDDFDYLSRAKCPYCGECFDPEGGDEGEVSCPDCDSTMILTPDYDVTYSTEKHECHPDYEKLIKEQPHE